MKLKVKKVHDLAELPLKKHPSDAGMDLKAVSKDFDEFGNIVYDTGIAVEIPLGYVGILAPRSSISERSISLANAIGVIDSNYRGSIKAKFKPTPYFEMRGEDYPYDYEVGERVVQLLIMPVQDVEVELTEELSKTDRDKGGFGSTGK